MTLSNQGVMNAVTSCGHMTYQGRQCNTEALLLWHGFGYLTSYLLGEVLTKLSVGYGSGVPVYIHECASAHVWHSNDGI